MARNVPKPSVSVTPGKNKRVNNVIKFENLVQKLRQGVPGAVRGRAHVKATERDNLTAIHKIAEDLEQHLRAVRRGFPEKPSRPSASSRKRKR